LAHHGLIYLIAKHAFLQQHPWEDWGKFVEQLINPVEEDVEMTPEQVNSTVERTVTQWQQEQQRDKG
jgi:hypothetical protein